MLPIRQHILATIGPLYDTNSTDSECYAIVLPALISFRWLETVFFLKYSPTGYLQSAQKPVKQF